MRGKEVARAFPASRERTLKGNTPDYAGAENALAVRISQLTSQKVA